MFDQKKIREIREELGYSQKEFYENIMSKASYQRFEKNEKEISIQQLQKICNRIAMRPEELLNLTDVIKLDSLQFWKKKLDLPNFVSTSDVFFQKLEELKNDKDKSFGHYCLYITMIALGNQSAYIKNDYFTRKDMRELKNKYKKRNKFYSFDYEIVSNITYFVNPDEISFLLDKLFPIEKSQGATFDFCVQTCLKNIATKYQDLEQYSLALDYITIYKSLRELPGFNINLSTNLEIVYLEQLTMFLQSRDITSFLSAVQTVKMFKQLGYNKTYETLNKELQAISQRDNFIYPDEILFATQPYSNDK